MEKYDKLVKALRCCASGACDDEKCDYIGMGAYGCMIGLAQDAADAIEALQADVKRMSVGFCKELPTKMRWRLLRSTGCPPSSPQKGAKHETD